MRLGMWVGALAVALVAAWVGAQTAGDEQTVSGFRVPSYDKDGNLTSQMFGESARIRPDGTVDITDLRMDFYAAGTVGTNREMAMRVTSPHCVYDRAAGVATSDAPVRIARDNMVVTGVGFRWTSSKERLEILGQSKVVLKDVKRNINSETER